MNRIISWLTKPFRNNFSYFVLLFLLISGIDLLGFIYHGLIPYSIYVFFHGYLVTYLLCLCASILPSFLSVIYKTILIGAASILFLADTFCLLIYQNKFNGDFFVIFLQTNLSETTEFIETFVSCRHILLTATFFFLLVGVFYLTRKYLHLGKRIQYIMLCAAVVGIGLHVRNSTVYKDTLIGRIIKITNISYASIPDLKEYQVRPSIITTKERQPQNVVMLIGESFSKSHSSLYNYDKETNPKLSTLKDSLLFVYKDILSA